MAYTSANAGQAAPEGGASLDRALRKLFPSTSKLTFNPLFRAAVNAFDVVPRLVFPEFRALPPNHLRIRIGVGNRILNNQTHFLVHARDFWMFVFSEGIATMQRRHIGRRRWLRALGPLVARLQFPRPPVHRQLRRRRHRRGSDRLVPAEL
jgi:hypothetical protein